MSLLPQDRAALHLSAAPGKVQIEISDSGKGLSPEAKYRLLSSGPVQSGGGVGLRLVHDLVTELGGAVRAQRRDRRTVITVEIPVGAGEGARRWPRNKQGTMTDNAFGVDLGEQQGANGLWVAPSMYNVVRQDGQDVHLAVVPDEE